jgi:hypothetical protein
LQDSSHSDDSHSIELMNSHDDVFQREVNKSKEKNKFWYLNTFKVTYDL